VTTAAVQDAPAQGKVQRSVRHTVLTLAAQYLLGIGVGLLGLPQDATGAAKVATTIFLILHVLLGIALLASAVLVVRAASRTSGGMGTLAVSAATLLVVSFVAGILTLASGNDWWSFLMAAGFILSLLVYGSLYARAGRA